MVTTTNDNAMGRRPAEGTDWTRVGPTVRRFARIGQAACILPGIEVGENAIVGASAVVTRDVPARTVVMGVPVRVARKLDEAELKH